MGLYRPKLTRMGSPLLYGDLNVCQQLYRVGKMQNRRAQILARQF